MKFVLKNGFLGRTLPLRPRNQSVEIVVFPVRGRDPKHYQVVKSGCDWTPFPPSPSLTGKEIPVFGSSTCDSEDDSGGISLKSVHRYESRFHRVPKTEIPTDVWSILRIWCVHPLGIITPIGRESRSPETFPVTRGSSYGLVKGLVSGDPSEPQRCFRGA